MSIEDAQASSDIRAHVEINQGRFYVVRGFNRTLVEMRPLHFEVIGTGAKTPQPRPQVHAHAQARHLAAWHRASQRRRVPAQARLGQPGDLHGALTVYDRRR